MQEKLAKLREEFNVKADDFELEFKKFHNGELKKAKRRGARDGQDNRPTADTEQVPAVEKEFYHSYSTQMSELHIDLGGFLPRVREDHIESLRNHLDELKRTGLSHQMQSLQEECHKELSDAEEEYHKNLSLLHEDPALRRLEMEYDDCDDQYDEMCDKLGRKNTNASERIPKWLHGVILLFIGLAEVAAIYVSFLNFEEPPLITWVMTIGIGLGLAGFGHLNGKFLSEGRESWIKMIIGVFLLLLIAVAIYFLAKLRMEGLDSAIKIKDIALPLFWIFSMILYSIATALSFLSHDSNPTFARIIKKRAELDAAVKAKEKSMYSEQKALHEKLQSTQKAINMKYNQEQEQLENHQDSVKFLLNDAITLYDDMLVSLRNLEKYVSAAFNECITTYRSENADHRSESEPKYWNSEIRPLSMVYKHKNQLNPDHPNLGLWHYNPN